MDDNISSQLKSIADKGAVDGIITSDEAIVVGKRMKNKFLREMVKTYKQRADVSDSDLIQLILAYDEVVENGLITNETIDAIEENNKLGG